MTRPTSEPTGAVHAQAAVTVKTGGPAPTNEAGPPALVLGMIYGGAGGAIVNGIAFAVWHRLATVNTDLDTAAALTTAGLIGISVAGVIVAEARRTRAGGSR